MCLVGFGVCEKAVFRISNCLALMVVRGPLRLEPEFPSSGDLFSVCESRVSGSPSSEPAMRYSIKAINFNKQDLTIEHLLNLSHTEWTTQPSSHELLKLNIINYSMEKGNVLDVKEIGINGANWIQLAQDRFQWQACVNTVMNLRVR
jgi:hypothetical protein